MTGDFEAHICCFLLEIENVNRKRKINKDRLVWIITTGIVAKNTLQLFQGQKVAATNCII